MSAELISITNGVVTIRITEKLSANELAELQQKMATAIRMYGKLRVLVLAEAFQGWEEEGNWGDFALQDQNDASIEKMAIVGDKRWEDLALIFTAKDLRPFPIEYFATADSNKARSWLDA